VSLFWGWRRRRAQHSATTALTTEAIGRLPQAPMEQVNSCCLAFRPRWGLDSSGRFTSFNFLLWDADGSYVWWRSAIFGGVGHSPAIPSTCAFKRAWSLEHTFTNSYYMFAICSGNRVYTVECEYKGQCTGILSHFLRSCVPVTSHGFQVLPCSAFVIIPRHFSTYST